MRGGRKVAGGFERKEKAGQSGQREGFFKEQAAWMREGREGGIQRMGRACHLVRYKRLKLFSCKSQEESNTGRETQLVSQTDLQLNMKRLSI